MADPHPIRLVVSDDLERSRLTTFFRLFLAIPHFVWILLWGTLTSALVLANWFIVLFSGWCPRQIHDLLARYIRYITHVNAYVLLAANPYPGFTGDPGYPVDVEIGPPARQNRWKTGFRLILALPAMFFASALFGSGGGRSNGYSASFGVAAAAAFLGWFAILARARMPRGLRDAAAWSIGYSAQLDAYLLLITDRYPNSDPAELLGPADHPDHPIRLELADEDLRRSRLTVFFRLPLLFPHIVWVGLWSLPAVLATVGSWFATLATGRSPDALHRFLSAYVRYVMHVSAFAYLVGNPFPGFVGEAGSYPVDVEIGPPARQNRWKTGFRLILAIPAWIVASAYSSLVLLVAVGGWFAGLFTGRMPHGLRNSGAVGLRYMTQTYAYLALLTDRYPYGGPTDLAPAPIPQPPPATEPPPAPAPA